MIRIERSVLPPTIDFSFLENAREVTCWKSCAMTPEFLNVFARSSIQKLSFSFSGDAIPFSALSEAVRTNKRIEEIEFLGSAEVDEQGMIDFIKGVFPHPKLRSLQFNTIVNRWGLSDSSEARRLLSVVNSESFQGLCQVLGKRYVRQ